MTEQELDFLKWLIPIFCLIPLSIATKWAKNRKWKLTFWKSWLVFGFVYYIFYSLAWDSYKIPDVGMGAALALLLAAPCFVVQVIFGILAFIVPREGAKEEVEKLNDGTVINHKRD